MTRVKICGITNLSDALHSVRCGADALGFNFYPASPRYVRPDTAHDVVRDLADGVVAKFGVFVNETIENMIEIATIASLDAIQLHGDESPELVRQLRAQTNCQIIKALRVSPGFDKAIILTYPADAILLDGYSPRERGGTGTKVDWSMAKTCAAMVTTFYLAGGLSADNVSEAIKTVRPFAVDACSELESKPGKKDPVKVEQFIAEVRGTI
jgi:phosphoribosylanthranilate isomerase